MEKLGDIHSVGNEYADEIAAYEEERRMRRSYYEEGENRANGGASDDGEMCIRDRGRGCGFCQQGDLYLDRYDPSAGIWHPCRI